MTDPVQYFRQVAAEHRRCFWLDGGGAREWSGRRSIIGWLDEGGVSLSYSRRRGTVLLHEGGGAVPVGDDPFAALEQRIRPSEQWFGYFGYAARPDLPARPDPHQPDALWMRADHVRLVEHPATPDPAGIAGAEVDRVPDWYRQAFDRVQEELRAGNSYEVNLTHRQAVESSADPAEVYLRLRALNPAPYAGFLQHDVAGARGWLLSSSPERYALVADGAIEAKPIKGTTPRAADPDEDRRLLTSLTTDPKFVAENLMIVDLLRNDLAMVCRPGTVAVPDLMVVESYPSVHQLASTVRGRLLPGTTTVSALRSLFPAGSMTGAPKLRTMQIIDAVEADARGAYAGAFGWISGDGSADLGVIIRSLMTSGDGTYRLGTGGGITVLSEVEEEYAEAQWKAHRLLAALE